MDGNVLGLHIVPDQMQVINPAIVLVLIPLFEKVLYPLLTKMNILENPLHRMAIGGIIAGVAFLAAGILELVLEKTYPELPEKYHASLNFINTLPCDLTVYSPFSKAQQLNATEYFKFRNIAAHNYTQYDIKIKAPMVCGDIKLARNEFKMRIHAIEYQVNKRFP